MKTQTINYQDSTIIITLNSETSNKLKNKLANFEVYEAAYGKIKSEKRKCEFLTTRIALNELLRKNVIVEYDNNGKPYLANSRYNISISHSKNWIAVIAHPSKNVGIDIECPTLKIKTIAHRFLSLEEQKYLDDINDSSKIQLAWSTKETLYKIIGNEAVDFSKQLLVYPISIDINQITAEHLATKKQYKLQFLITTDYFVVFCVDK